MSITTMESSTIQAIPENQRHGNARDLFTIWFGSLLGTVLCCLGGEML